ncbi:MAG: DUF1330 domain-containing protein [Sphingomonadaceae bacterium]
MIAALAFLLQSLPPSAALPPPPQSTCDEPVYMVIAGQTHDRARMMAYGKAIADSRLYERLGGYYINQPRPLATFEGEPESGQATLIVRFPCIENARAFWYSREYQDTIRPLRLDPSAGDYLVTVYAEAPLRPDLVGKVGDAGYRETFDPAGVEQVAGLRP